MICEALSDRMPAVARGAAIWDPDEAAHFDTCDECRAEWALVAPLARRAAMGQVGELNLDTVAETLRGRLVRRSQVIPIGSRRRWIGPLVGLAAAAAVIVAVASRSPADLSEDVAQGIPVRATTTIPELDALLESELELLLATLEPDASGLDLQPSGTPRLGDLTADELELLLESMEG